MPYSQFKTLESVITKFNLTVQDRSQLFSHVAPIAPSSRLQADLAEGLDLAIAVSTEKVRSELLIMPVLMEVRRHFIGHISLFSGKEFNVDPDQDLNGWCDFLLSASPVQSIITAPVLTVVESKENDLRVALGQCVAEMVASQIFNARQNLSRAVYGAVTTGTTWRFLCLTEQLVQLDLTEYFINQIEFILGILALPFLPSET